MDSANIFICLSKQPPTSEKNPEENFFTNSFALILRKEKLIHYLLKGLSEKHEKLKKIVESIPEREDVEIATQSRDYTRNRSGFVPDIEIKNDQFLLLIENKLDYPLDELQLRNYRTEIKGKEKEFCLYITKNFEEKLNEVDDQNFEHVRWYELYEILQNHAEKSTLVKEFLKFMEVKGMKPAKLEQSGKNYAEAWKTFSEFKEFGEEFFDEITPQLETLKDKLENKWGETKIGNDNEKAIGGYFGKYLQLKKSKGEFGVYVWFSVDNSEVNLNVGLYYDKKGVSADFGREFERLKNFELNEEDGRNFWFKKKPIGNLYQEKDRKEQMGQVERFVKEVLGEIKDSEILDRLKKQV